MLAVSLMLASVGAAQAQDSPVVPAPSAPKKTMSVGGRHKPSLTGSSYLRVLVVWVRYHGDTLRTPSWPDPATLPSWARYALDDRAPSIGNHPDNISEYFRRNSNGLFRIIGDTYYVTTDSSEEYYHMRYEGRDEDLRGAIIREVLTKLDDSRGRHRIDFRRYDRWNNAADFRAKSTPDGNVDMIWVLTRTHAANPYPDGDPRRKRYRDYGRTSADFNVQTAPLRFDGVRVNHTAGFVEGAGSGVMVFASNATKPYALNDSIAGGRGETRLYGELIHELSHYLFGSNHFGNSDISLSPTRYTSYFTAYAITNGNGYGNMLGYEKMRLGWVNSKDGTLRIVRADEADVTFALEDPHTMGRKRVQAAIIELPGTDQYFLLENRGWKGPFEARRVPYQNTGARLAPGLLLTHMITEDEAVPFTRARVVCADGKYRWRVTRDDGSRNNAYSAIEKDSADAFGGYDERERIFVSGYPGRSWLAGFWPAPAGKPRAIGPYLGCSNCADSGQSATDNCGDAFDVFQPGDVVTPWSNPALSVWTGREFVLPQGSQLGIHILARDEKTGAIRVRVRRGRLDDFPPSRPTLLRLTDTARAVLSWAPNREPAMADSSAPGRYEIQRSIHNGPYHAIGTVMHPQTFFTDTFYGLDFLPSAARYRVRAVLANGSSSNWSEEVTARYY